MGWATLFLLAFGLSMDAFAVSVTNGMCYRMNAWKNALLSGCAFGLFQALMPLVGYYAGHSFSHIIENVDHWIALVLLVLIGGRMIYETIKGGDASCSPPPPRVFSVRTLFLQAIATSIDALAVGVGLGVIQVNIWLAVSLIGTVTFFCSGIGVLIGKRFGQLLRRKAEVLGGVILIFIGLKIFLEHTLLAG